MLTLDEKRRVFQVFEESLELDAAARQRFLDQHCGDSEAIKAEIIALHRADTQASLNTGGLGALRSEQPDQQLGRIVGNFKLVEHLGSGGMGLVFRGERTDDLSQRVAVKLVRQELRSATSRARFQQESSMLARLEHPSIARLIDAGVADDGRPWYVMEYVGGTAIDIYCERQQLGTRERVELLIAVCRAVDAAHRLLVVHRDIKPSNVLVTADGTPKLIDFGIAKFLDETAGAGLTRESGAAFTPHFAAPEQVAGETISTATDVYGLGALAFLLLTGKKIFESGTRTDLDYMLAVTQREPELPSRIGSNALLRGDLDNILRKALARLPAQRYESAAALAADFASYLAHRPVQARAPTLLYRVGKFVRRNTIAVSLGGLLLAATLAGLVVFLLQSREVATQRNQAQLEAARTHSINEFLINMLKSADPRIGARETTVAQVLDRAVSDAGRSLPHDPAVAGSVLQAVAETNDSLGRYPEALASNALALEMYRKSGQSAREYAVTLAERGALLRQSGKPGEAEPLLRDAVARIRALAPGSVDDAMASDRLAVLLSNTDREAEAVPLYRAAIAQLKAAGVRDVRLVTVLNDLAVCLGNQGDFANAVPMHREAVAVAEAVLGPDNPSTDDARANLAGALEGSGEIAAAEHIYREVVANRRKALGADHIDTLWAMTSLANNLLTQKRSSDALPLAGDAIARLQAGAGRDGPITLYAQSVGGRAACESGDYEHGLRWLASALAGRQRAMPRGSWLVANTQALLGACQMYSGALQSAQQNLLQAVATLESQRGAAFDKTQDAYRNLALVYEKQGNVAEAARWRARLKPPTDSRSTRP